MIAAGDVSATNVLAGIYSVDGEKIVTLFEDTYKGQEIKDFNEQVVADMLKESGLNRRELMLQSLALLDR
ncbi:hypothetical protein A3K73_03585 [Candidatus Pacearchaeota archaeon RBG_13_36_9]|nr:MAG: hypothetical protein A3K73_03585 [Candidatus Pacearchaeota archaeon RBG_13_36_9]